MFYVYFLKSDKDGGLYIGRTNNLERRLKEHSTGRVQSTKARRPLFLLGCDECETEEASILLEIEYKKGYNRERIKERFKI